MRRFRQTLSRYMHRSLPLQDWWLAWSKTTRPGILQRKVPANHEIALQWSAGNLYNPNSSTIYHCGILARHADSSNFNLTPNTTNTTTRGHGHETLSPKRNRKAEYSQTSDVTEQYGRIIDANTTPPNRQQVTNTNRKLRHSQVPTFRGNKDRFNDFEHLLHNHLWAFSKRITKETKLRYFQSLLHKDTIEIFL